MKEEFYLKKGFTLTEMLISVSIFILIMLVVTSFNRDIFFINSGLQSNLNAQIEARNVLRVVVAELRSVSPSSLGAYALPQTGTSSIIFYSNVDNDQYKERIRYFLQGTDFNRGIIHPSGSPLTYNVAQEQVQTLVRNVRNGATSTFDYFDKNYSGTSTPLSLPVDPLLVRLVRVTLFVDSDPNRFPGVITLTSQAMLRNLKDNL